MKVEIKNELNDQENKYLFNWSDQVFPIEGRLLVWSKLPQHILMRDDKKRAVAHVGFGEFTITVGKAKVDVIGVGGVVVRPEYQGQNLPAIMFKKLEEITDKEKAIRLTLFCPKRLVNYYKKHQYKLYKGTVTFLQNKNPIESTFCFMINGAPISHDCIELTCEPW